MAVHLAVAGDVFDGVFVLSFFPWDVLDESWDLIESVSGGFPTYSCIYIVLYVYCSVVLYSIAWYCTSCHFILLCCFALQCIALYFIVKYCFLTLQSLLYTGYSFSYSVLIDVRQFARVSRHVILNTWEIHVRRLSWPYLSNGSHF